MITVATQLWKPNKNSHHFSRCYNEEWVERLYRGVGRNLTRPFRFVCLVDEGYQLSDDINQVLLLDPDPSYSTTIEAYRLGVPMIKMGLDTVITGNIDHFADYCLNGQKLMLHRDQRKPSQSANGIALVPAGHRHIFEQHSGENDLDWLRAQPHDLIDDRWPGHVMSYKEHVAKHGLGEDVRVVYFHGNPKMQHLGHLDWIREHWR